MDWDKALERNGLALLRIIAPLFALLVSARLAGSGLMVPRHVCAITQSPESKLSKASLTIRLV